MAEAQQLQAAGEPRRFHPPIKTEYPVTSREYPRVQQLLAMYGDEPTATVLRTILKEKCDALNIPYPTAP